MLRSISLALALVLATMVPACRSQQLRRDSTTAAVPDAIDVAALRAEGPDGLAKLLARYDALPDGAAKEQLGRAVDQVAGQRFATVSRLYWFTDLDAARAAARESGKPILSLRMLGRLDEDFSCANSRFFRVALYANAEVSKFLRDNFILHWSSERPVPRVTIDFGDGRRLVRTVAGNSIHYVLDAEGRPVDALPGLYGPKAFVAALGVALPVAKRAGKLEGRERVAALRTYLTAQTEAAALAWSTIGGGGSPYGRVYTLDNGTLLEAEYVTQGKGAYERPMVRGARLGPQGVRIADEAPYWDALGAQHLDDARLDAQSRRLLGALEPMDWSDDPHPLRGEALAGLIDRFERAIAADTLRNEYKLHVQIRAWLVAQPAQSLDELNTKVYGSMFLTPASDAWLGMATKDAFSGLPRDGIVASR